MSKEIFIFRTYVENGVLVDEDNDKKYNLLIIPAGKLILDEANKTIKVSLEHMQETIKLQEYGSPAKLFELGNTENYWNYREDVLEGGEDLASKYKTYFATPDNQKIGVDFVLAMIVNERGIKYVIATDTGVTAIFFKLKPSEVSASAHLIYDMFTYQRPEVTDPEPDPEPE